MCLQTSSNGGGLVPSKARQWLPNSVPRRNFHSRNVSAQRKLLRMIATVRKANVVEGHETDDRTPERKT